MRSRLAACLTLVLVSSCGETQHPFSSGAQPGAPWPQLGGDATRSGTSAVRGPRKANVAWKFDLGSPIGTASPVIAADGTIYVGSNNGRFVALAPNGTEKWRVEVGATISGAAAIGADGSIVVASNDAQLRRIDPTGRVVSTTLLRASITSSVLLDQDGTAYVDSTDDDGAYFITRGGSAHPMATPARSIVAGRLLMWRSGRPNTATGAAPYHDDVVEDPQFGSAFSEVACVDRGGTKFYAGGTMIDASGKTVWDASQLPGDYYRGNVNWYSPETCAFAPDGTVYERTVGTLRAFDGAGREKWRLQLFVDSKGRLATDSEGTVYFGGDDGVLVAIAADGSLVFRLATNGPLRSSPAIGADGTLFVGSDDGFLYAIGGG